MGPNGPKMLIFGQKSQFWAKFGRLWAKNPNFYVKFLVPITKKKPLQLVPIAFWSPIGSIKNANNWPKLPVLGPNPFFGGYGVKLLVSSHQVTNKAPFCVEKIDRWGSNWPLGTKKCFFDPKIWIFGAKSQFLYGNREFCQQGISPVYSGLQLSHSDHPQKKFRFRARGHFLGLTPVFGRFWPLTR